MSIIEVAICTRRNNYPRVFRVLLQNFLHMVIVFADSVGKSCRSLPNEELPLYQGIVFAAKDACQLFKHLQFFLWHRRPGLFETVHWIALQSGDDGLERREVLQHPQYLQQNKIVKSADNTNCEQENTWAISIHLAMTLALCCGLASGGQISTVDMTRYDTALNCSTVATTVAASRSRDLSRRDQTAPRH
jgi:hypothetical protein